MCCKLASLLRSICTTTLEVLAFGLSYCSSNSSFAPASSMMQIRLLNKRGSLAVTDDQFNNRLPPSVPAATCMSTPALSVAVFKAENPSVEADFEGVLGRDSSKDCKPPISLSSDSANTSDKAITFKPFGNSPLCSRICPSSILICTPESINGDGNTTSLEPVSEAKASCTPLCSKTPRPVYFQASSFRVGKP